MPTLTKKTSAILVYSTPQPEIHLRTFQQGTEYTIFKTWVDALNQQWHLINIDGALYEIEGEIL
jgi:hypothetical protein